MTNTIKAVLIIIAFFIVLGVSMHMDPLTVEGITAMDPVPLGMQYPLCALYYGSAEVDLYCVAVEYGIVLD